MLKHLRILGDDVEGLFERCPHFFLNFPKEFARKMEILKSELGTEYIDLIEDNVDLLENN